MKTLSRAYICQFSSLTYFNFAWIYSQPFFSLQNKQRECSRFYFYGEDAETGTLRRNPPIPRQTATKKKEQRIISPLGEKERLKDLILLPGLNRPGAPRGWAAAPPPCAEPVVCKNLQNSRLGKEEPAPPNPPGSGQKKNAGPSIPGWGGGYFPFWFCWWWLGFFVEFGEGFVCLGEEGGCVF